MHGGSWSGRAAPLSDDPMVAYRWAPGANTTELQLFTRAPTRVVVQAGRCAEAQRLLGPSPLRVAIAEPTRLMLDFGAELPAWWEIDSPDLAASNAVLSMGVGEYNTPWQEGPGRHKTGRPKRYGSTYRLETGNAALYEGVRFAFLEVSAPPGATLIPFTIAGARLVVSRHDIAAIWVAFFSRWQRYRCRQVQTKPVNYAGHFTASDPMVVSRTIMALEQHIWADPRKQPCGQEKVWWTAACKIVILSRFACCPSR